MKSILCLFQASAHPPDHPREMGKALPVQIDYRVFYFFVHCVIPFLISVKKDRMITRKCKKYFIPPAIPWPDADLSSSAGHRAARSPLPGF
jgi:hypothetical protein